MTRPGESTTTPGHSAAYLAIHQGASKPTTTGPAATDPAAIKPNNCQAVGKPILPTTVAPVEVVARLDTALAVYVRSHTPGKAPQARAKLLLTLPAARRALAAARARGHDATAVLVELHVVGGVE